MLTILLTTININDKEANRIKHLSTTSLVAHRQKSPNNKQYNIYNIASITYLIRFIKRISICHRCQRT